MTSSQQPKSDLGPIPSQNHEAPQRKKWQLEQTIKYCEFVKLNRQTLQFPQKKQKQRIYNKMSQYIGTRTTHQCRSHHQKVLKRYSTIDGFLKNFTDKIHSARTFMEWSQTELEGLESMRKLQNCKKIDLDNIPKPYNSPSTNQFPFFHTLNTSIVPHPQIKHQFFTPNQPGFQYSRPKKAQSEPGDSTFMTQELLSEQYPRKVHTFLGPRPKHYLDNQFSHFHVPSAYSSFDRAFDENGSSSQYFSKAQTPLNHNELAGKFHHLYDHEKKFTEPYEYQSPGYLWASHNAGSQAYSLMESWRPLDRRPTNAKPNNVLIPSFETLNRNEDSLINNAHSICLSIRSGQNQDAIQPFIDAKRIQFQGKNIIIHGKENENYSCRIECVKVQEPEPMEEEANSDSEQIRREMTEEIIKNILKDYVIIPRNDLHQKQSLVKGRQSIGVQMFREYQPYYKKMQTQSVSTSLSDQRGAFKPYYLVNESRKKLDFQQKYIKNQFLIREELKESSEEATPDSSSQLEDKTLENKVSVPIEGFPETVPPMKENEPSNSSKVFLNVPFTVTSTAPLTVLSGREFVNQTPFESFYNKEMVSQVKIPKPIKQTSRNLQMIQNQLFSFQQNLVNGNFSSEIDLKFDEERLQKQSAYNDWKILDVLSQHPQIYQSNVFDYSQMFSNRQSNGEGSFIPNTPPQVPVQAEVNESWKKEANKKTNDNSDSEEAVQDDQGLKQVPSC